MARDDQDDFYDDIPLERKKPFGSGLKLKQVDFVSGSDGDLESTREEGSGTSGDVVSDLYLNVVMKNPAQTTTMATPTDGVGISNDARKSASPRQAAEVCPDCNLLLSHDDDDEAHRDASSKRAPTAVATMSAKEQQRAQRRRHEGSIAHQASQPHSHPPSALDRRRMGLAYLESHGWDPDARRGLGADEQGMPLPLRAKLKDDHLGVGLEIPEEVRRKAREEEKAAGKKKRKMKLKERLAAEKKKNKMITDMFFEKEEVLKYLGKPNVL